MTRIRLGTRGSRLATAQSADVAHLLEERTPGLRIEFVEIRTSGDRIRDVPLGPHLGQSFFTKEIENALLDRRIDLAVHSCKDLATAMVPGLRLAAVPMREDPRDCIVSAGAGLSQLCAGARVGTSSPRRKAFLAAARPDLMILDLRGNLPTRLRTVEDGTLDAVILAVSGLRRLGLAERIAEALDPDVMMPAASQGALALQIRDDDTVTSDIVMLLNDADARAQVTAERACLRTLEAGCQTPVGALGRTGDGELRLDVALFTPDGLMRVRRTGRVSEADNVGEAAASDLLGQLGLDSLRNAPWAGPAPLRLPESAEPLA